MKTIVLSFLIYFFIILYNIVVTLLLALYFNVNKIMFLSICFSQINENIVCFLLNFKRRNPWHEVYPFTGERLGLDYKTSSLPLLILANLIILQKISAKIQTSIFLFSLSFFLFLSNIRNWKVGTKSRFSIGVVRIKNSRSAH